MVSATDGVTTAAYTYDAFGRRIQQTVDGITTKFLYDGDQVIAEYESGGISGKYVYGSGIDEPILMQRGGESYYYHFDGLGSVTVLTDSSGETIESYSYDVFGKPNITSTVGNRFMFTGREYDPETGLCYYRARYYSPGLGRFLQVDPFDYMEGSNLYRYVNNNPINLVDPWGYKPGDKYPTQDDAAKDALKDIHQPSISKDREYGGYVYRNNDGTYSYTPPKEGNQHGINDLGPKPPGTTADYHSHGAESGPGYDDENFSPQDKQDNRNQGTDGYLGTPSGKIKEYNPSTNQESEIGNVEGKKEKQGKREIT